MLLQLQVQRQKQQATLRAENEMLDSLFPSVEKALREKPVIRSLGKALSRKDSSRYMSLMDMFFVELFPIWKPSCFKYYRGKGKPLRDLLSLEQIFNYETAMMSALVLCMILHDDMTNFSWKFFQAEAEHRLKNEWPY